MIGRSKLRGPGTQTGLAGAGTGVGILKMPFLAVIGEAMGGGRAMDGGVGQEPNDRRVFLHKICCRILRYGGQLLRVRGPVGVPSIIVIRQQSPCVTTSSKKRA